MSFMLLLWVLSTTWDLGYGYGYGLTSFYSGFVLCIFFFFRFVIDEPIKLAFFFFFPITTLAIWDSERELAVPGMY